jgi:hypothetical protein
MVQVVDLFAAKFKKAWAEQVAMVKACEALF